MNDETTRDLVPQEGKLDLTTIKLTPTGGLEISNAKQLLDMAKAMSKANIAVRKHLRDNPGACLGVLMQAMNWQMQPFLVASKSFLVNDQLAYEAQLLHAVILKHAPMKGRPKIEFLGEGPERQVRVSAKGLEDDEVVEYVSPKIKDINPKNSPLWVNDPDQQLSYYGVRGLARRHFPDVLMGAYAPDELERTPYQGEMQGFNPLAAPHDGQTIEGGVSYTPAAGQTIEHDPETGEVQATPETEAAEIEAEKPAPKPKRQRKKAEPPPQREIKEPTPDEPGNPPAPDAVPLTVGLQLALEGAHTIAEWAAVLEKYKPAYDDMRENLPDVALAMAKLGNDRRAVILKDEEANRAMLQEVDKPAEPQEAAPVETAPQVAEEPESPAELDEGPGPVPWSNELETPIAKWDHIPDVRELCLFLWLSADAEDADARYATIQARRAALPDPGARLAVRTMLSAVRRKFGQAG